jgi:hypothetical protein
MARYTVRYTKEGSATITAVSNYMDLSDLLKGDAKGAIVESKISENMPLTMHNEIAKHNGKLNEPKVSTRKIKAAAKGSS